jgi:hypothetical protein
MFQSSSWVSTDYRARLSNHYARLLIYRSVINYKLLLFDFKNFALIEIIIL